MSEEKYFMGYDDSMIKWLAATRNFERCAAFTEPFLSPSMKILDCGCGPGSITTGFAQRVPQGEIVALDISQEQLDIVRKSAERLGISNIKFQQGDVLNLPFKDNTFDLVYTSALILQLSDNKKAVEELHRVLKPHGVIALREPDFGNSIFYPDTSTIRESNDYKTQALLNGGVDLYMGRKLKALLNETGFEDVKVSVCPELISEDGLTQILCGFVVDEFSTAQYVKDDLKSGKLTQEKLDQYKQAWRDFGKEPNAFTSWCWMQAVGRKP